MMDEAIMETVRSVLKWLLIVGGVLLVAWLGVFAAGMYVQEVKSFKRVKFFTYVRFVLTWMIGSFFFSACCLPEILFHPDRVREKAHRLGSIMGQYLYSIVGKQPDVAGLEYVPSNGDEAVVYVANHNSSVDIALFYQVGIGRRFAWVSKSSVFGVPGVGLIMKLSKYVSITRGRRDSVLRMFSDCKDSLRAGWPVVIFPQGTRRRHKILDFKNGAFELAMEAKVAVVPVTLYLPEDLFFSPKERAKLTVHKPVRPSDPEFKDVETLKKHCFDVIMSALPYAKDMIAAQEKAKAEAAAAAAAGGGEGAGATAAAAAAAPAEAKKTK